MTAASIQFLAIVGLICLAAVLVLTLWWFRPRPKCPECGSHEVGLTSKEPLGMRTSDYHSGGEGGGYSAVQLRYRVRYSCNQCQASWTKTITETS